MLYSNTPSMTYKLWRKDENNYDQGIRRSRSLQNWGRTRGFVKMSAIWSLVETYSMDIILLTMYERKWWSLIQRCLVRGRVLWLVAKFIQLILISNVLHFIRGAEPWMGKPCNFRSSNKRIMVITSRRAVDNAIYSASIVLNAIKDWTFDFQMIGHPAYVM